MSLLLTTSRWLRIPAVALVLLSVATVAATEESEAYIPARRAKIGLALSGGGARGFAHIGVLRALERAGVPVDFIAGTSMGSIVGGLYATGYSVDDLIAVASELDWASILAETPDRRALFFSGKDESARALLSLRIENWRIQLPTGVTRGDRAENLLSLLTLGADGVRSFDRLPVPFRAVATDLATGAEVVLDGSQTSLARAIRASISIPGVFEPVVSGDMALVDGGLVKNLPVDVVKAMGADIVIAVDISTPLRSRDQLDSLVAIIDQSISLQIAASTARQRELADLLITPELDGFSSSDFDRVGDLIVLGETAVTNHAEALAAIVAAAGGPAESQPRRLDLVGPGARDEEVVISRVKVRGDADIQDLQLIRDLGIASGDRLKVGEIQERLRRIFGVDFFDTVSFSLVDVGDGRKRLDVRVRKRDDVLLRFGARFNEVDSGVGLVELVSSGVFRSRSVASASLQFGGILAAELYYFEYGLGKTGFFVRPSVFYRRDPRKLYNDDGDSIAEFTGEHVGAQASVGNTFRNLGEISLTYRWKYQRWVVDVGARDLQEYRDPVGAAIAALAIDTLDRFPYPTEGTSLRLEWEWSNPILGSSFDYHRASMDFATHRTLSDQHTFTLRARLGVSLADGLPAFAEFVGGGPDLLYGFEREELAGDHLAVAGVDYRYRLTRLPLGLGDGVFIKLGYGVGNAWESIDDIEEEPEPAHGGGFGLGLDTVIGPIDAGVGFASGGRTAFYLSIGYPF